VTLLAVALAALTWQFGAAQVRSFEQLAAADISARLQGPEREVTVRAEVGPEALFGDVHRVTLRARRFEAEELPLYTEPGRSTRGHLRFLRLDLEDFTLRGLRVESLRGEIRNSRFDLPLAMNHRQIRLSRSGDGEGEVVVDEKDLERFLLLKFHEVKRAQVRIEKDKLFVDGYGEFVLLATEFTVIARLEPVDGSRFELAHARILIGGQPAEGPARDVLLRSLNPVIDLDRDLGLHGAMHVEKLILADGKVRALGRLRVPAAPTGTFPPLR
jgi:hypothetical protein